MYPAMDATVQGPSVGGDGDQGNAPNISVGDQEPSHQLFIQHQ